ncbi:PHP domain-containing protein [[Limnothrix rosea] IAM M-220]|uniref:PHP domain-containing protein n=1 Tax=[Limnothrix rosea] IAM M-220 TaxID=454133 RepID=UPI0009655ABD|nr:PHP domain-containing protein [[Limnothrix rosea] IAM M-220]OKH12354.1 phosphatase [[Limnothrix rosea] IAM M-220]
MTSTLSVATAAQDVQALKGAWRSITPTSCPLHYNFHMHSVFSDGQLTPEQIVDQAIAIGLSGFAITDHHTVNGFWQAQAYLAEQQKSQTQPVPQLWTGIEINGVLLDTGVHILGYGFDPDHPDLEPYRQREIQQGDRAAAQTIVAAIHQAGGLAVLAHPARYRRPAQDLVPAAVEQGFDGIEAYYAYSNPNPWRSSDKHTAAMQTMGEQYNLWLTCGTDTHGCNLLRRL